jgi:hypothetical protein
MSSDNREPTPASIVTTEMLEREHALGHSNVDWVPNPETLTVGSMPRLIHDMTELQPSFELGDHVRMAAYVRRNHVLCESHAYRAFSRWANTELGRDADFEAAKELQSLLARRLKRMFGEIDLMPLADAIWIVEELDAGGVEAPAPPIEGSTQAHAKRTPGTQKRRRGQALRPDEERVYKRIIKKAKSLK